jgi:hypothetical protein
VSLLANMTWEGFWEMWQRKSWNLVDSVDRWENSEMRWAAANLAKTRAWGRHGMGLVYSDLFDSSVRGD